MDSGISNLKLDRYEIAKQEFEGVANEINQNFGEIYKGDRYPETILFPINASAYFGLGLSEGLMKQRDSVVTARRFEDLASIVHQFMEHGTMIACTAGDFKEDHYEIGHIYATLGWKVPGVEILEAGPKKYMEQIKDLTDVMTKGDYWESAARYIGEVMGDGGLGYRENGWDKVMDELPRLIKRK